MGSGSGGILVQEQDSLKGNWPPHQPLGLLLFGGGGESWAVIHE